MALCIDNVKEMRLFRMHHSIWQFVRKLIWHWRYVVPIFFCELIFYVPYILPSPTAFCDILAFGKCLLDEVCQMSIEERKQMKYPASSSAKIKKCKLWIIQNFRKICKYNKYVTLTWHLKEKERWYGWKKSFINYRKGQQ